MNLSEKNRRHLQSLCLGGLFIALFAVISNLPFLSAVQLLPGVPLTLQVFLIALMALTLDLKSSLLTLTSLLVLTLCGLPLMSGGRGGPAALVGSACGYIYGWYLIILLLGWYREHGMARLMRKKALGIPLHIPASLALGLAGVLLDYACGTLGLLLIGGTPLSAFGASYLTGLAFLPADVLKILGASLVSMFFFRSRALHGQYR